MRSEAPYPWTYEASGWTCAMGKGGRAREEAEGGGHGEPARERGQLDATRHGVGVSGGSIDGGSGGGVIGGGPSRDDGEVPRMGVASAASTWAMERGADAPARRCRRARGADDRGGARGAHHVAFSGRKVSRLCLSSRKLVSGGGGHPYITATSRAKEDK